MNLEDLHIITTYKEIDLDQEQNELSLYFSELLREQVGLQGARTTKSIQLNPFEEKLIKAFCDENKITLSEVIRYCFWSTGWIDKDLVLAISHTAKNTLSAPGGYLTLNHDDFTYEYLKKYEGWNEVDFEKEFSVPSKTKTIRDHTLVIESIEKERMKAGFPSFSYAAKQCLFDLNIYPNISVPIAKRHLKVVKEQDNLSEAQLKAKALRQKKAALARTRGDADPTIANRSKKMAVSAFDFEQDHIIEPFLRALKGKNLSLSTLVKHKLLEHRLISDDMLRMTDKDKLACREFTYEVPEAEGDMDYYYNKKMEGFGSKRRINNISVLVEAKDAIQSKLGRGFAQWVRKNCMLEAYPVIDKESVVKVFISR